MSGNSLLLPAAARDLYSRRRDDARVGVPQLCQHGRDLLIGLLAIAAAVGGHHVLLQLIRPPEAVEALINKGLTCAQPGHERGRGWGKVGNSRRPLSRVRMGWDGSGCVCDSPVTTS